jgi:hypothetical protein
MDDAPRSPTEQPTAIVISREITVTATPRPAERPVAPGNAFRDLVLRALDAVDELADDVALRLGLR